MQSEESAYPSRRGWQGLGRLRPAAGRPLERGSWSRENYKVKVLRAYNPPPPPSRLPQTTTARAEPEGRREAVTAARGAQKRPQHQVQDKETEAWKGAISPKEMAWHPRATLGPAAAAAVGRADCSIS
ncbi:hypothetical protein MC885_018727, partial [Smutsia gigantea]